MRDSVGESLDPRIRQFPLPGMGGRKVNFRLRSEARRHSIAVTSIFRTAIVRTASESSFKDGGETMHPK